MTQSDQLHEASAGETLVAIAKNYGLSLGQLLSANPLHRADPNSLPEGRVIKIPSARKEYSSVRFENGSLVSSEQPEHKAKKTDAVDYFSVPTGQLTFNCEGAESRGRQFSRKPHVPKASSGVTIGRGYDMRNRSEQEIYNDLMESGVDPADARKLSACRHLSGPKARRFLQDLGYNRIEITPESQYRLFLLICAELEGEILRVCNKLDVVDKYGRVLWPELPQVIKDLVIDVCFCGDYTGATRERIQPCLVTVSLQDLMLVFSDQYYWIELRGVSLERFQARKAYLAAYIEKKADQFGVTV